MRKEFNHGVTSLLREDLNELEVADEGSGGGGTNKIKKKVFDVFEE